MSLSKIKIHSCLYRPFIKGNEISEERDIKVTLLGEGGYKCICICHLLIKDQLVNFVFRIVMLNIYTFKCLERM